VRTFFLTNQLIHVNLETTNTTPLNNTAMNALHLIALRYIALVELLALERITARLRSFSAEYVGINNSITCAIKGNRTWQNYYNSCGKALKEWYAEQWLLDGDNEFRFDFAPYTYTMTIRVMNYVLAYRQVPEHDEYELLNKVSDITEGYLSASHREFKEYAVNIKSAVARSYSERV
jgi:hypothetical protein